MKVERFIEFKREFYKNIQLANISYRNLGIFEF